MSIGAVGMKAYVNALQNFNKSEATLKSGGASDVGAAGFAKTLDQTLLRDSVDKGEGFGAQADFMEFATKSRTPLGNDSSFTGTVKNSLNRVNELQSAKSAAIEDFAAGRTQNVHELMITLQKAGLAMSLTSAVRSKVMEAYKELSHMQF